MSSFFVTLQKEGAKVNISIPDGLTLKANKAYVYSVFYNLISNAIKYRSQERPLQVDLNCFGDEQKGIIISFSDNGSGFDAQKEKKNLFKLYKRFHPKQEGRGMGLYLVKNHIEAMGGRIEVSSKVGIGTSFLIHLPQE
nr:HAMP domain-containing sensor histidine kinase [Sabulibacter ruber]